MTKATFFAAVLAVPALMAGQAMAQAQINFINCGAGQDGHGPVQAAHIAEWAAANAIEVVTEFVPWGQCQEKSLTLAAAGNPPAMAYMGSRVIKQLVESDLIVPMNLSAAELASYEPAVMATVTVDGQQWGLPRAFSTKALFYNKDLFEAAGLPSERGPRNWDELIAAAKAVSENTDAAGIGLAAASFDNTMHQFLNFMYANNGEVVDKSGNIAFDSASVVETLELYRDLVPYAQSGPIAYDRAKLEPLFAEGQIAMYVNGGWGRSRTGDVNYGLAGIPAGPGGAQSTLLITDSIVVFKGSGVEDAALDLAKYLTTPERQFAIDSAGGWTPIRVVPGVARLIADDPTWQVFVDGIAIGGPEPLLTDYVGTQDAINEAIQGVILGELEPAEAAREAAERLEDLL